jgi:hypothetical protein
VRIEGLPKIVRIKEELKMLKAFHVCSVHPRDYFCIDYLFAFGVGTIFIVICIYYWYHYCNHVDNLVYHAGVWNLTSLTQIIKCRSLAALSLAAPALAELEVEGASRVPIFFFLHACSNFFRLSEPNDRRAAHSVYLCAPRPVMR